MPNPDDFPRIDRLMDGWEPTWPMTVRTIAEYLWCNQGIRATCRACGHFVDVDLVSLGEKLGRNTSVDAVCRALRCKAEGCGSKRAPAIIVTTVGDLSRCWRPKHRRG